MGHQIVRSVIFMTVLQIFVLSTVCILRSPPMITKQPPTDELLFKSDRDETDEPLYIECEAEGEPAPVYRWTKNGRPFEWQADDDRIAMQPGRGSLVITAPRDEDLGQYQCIAENQLGTAISNSVFVRKAELNSFRDEHPVSLNANEGDPFKLTCQPPDGWPRPNVFWLIQNSNGGIKSINNSRMTLDPEGNLWFSNVTKNDASNDFWYACAATSVFRNEYKLGNRVLLNVISTGASASKNKHEPVRQYVTRKNEIALRGKKIELYCIYGGTPLPQIVWNKDGQVLHPNERITQGNYGKSLVIKHINSEDQGSYTCEATNGVGDAKSYSIYLQVLAIPYFTVEPEVITAAEDETVEITCEAGGVPEPQIEWIHNGKPIEETPLNPRRNVSANSIVIEKLSNTDTGNYGCNATNSLGYVYKDVYVNVMSMPPEITDPPTDALTVDGKPFRFTCRVFGIPKPEVKWLRNGQELTGGGYKTLPSGDLEIARAFFPDSGTFNCHAFNKFGEVNASAILVVKEHTVITDEPEDLEVAAGSTATFRCNAMTDWSLTLTIDWLRNGNEIDFELEPRLVKSNDNSLTILRTTELDSGTYTCIARTELDEAVAQATLTVQDVPNPPLLVGVACLNNKATVQWANMGDNRAPIVRYTIQANTSFTPDTWEIAMDNVITRTYDVPMSPWANYTFRVLAWNKIGPSAPSLHSEVCTTQPDVPYKNPDNVEGKGTEPQNIVISWTAMPQIEHNAPRFMYRVSYKRDIPGEEWISEDVNDWTQNRLQVVNQPSYKRYKIKVLAINERGECRLSPREVTGWSGEDVPQEAPSDFRLLNVKNGRSALFAWSAVPEESIRGEFKGYKIQTWTDKEGEKGMREIHVRNIETKALVTKFWPYSKNYVRIVVYNGRYDGPASEILSFETPEAVPGPVHGVTGFPLGSSALYLDWNKPKRPNGILTGYKVYYQEVQGTSIGPLLQRQSPIQDPKVTRVKLAGLKPDTRYRVRIAATTKVGEGTDYFIEQKTKRPSPASPPQVPDFSWQQIPMDGGLTTIKVIWLPSQDGNPGSHFFVKYRIKGEAVGYETVPEFYEDTIQIPGVTREVYVMSVVAVDGEYFTESLPQKVDTRSWELENYPFSQIVLAVYDRFSKLLNLLKTFT